MAGFIASVLNVSIESVERWPTEKTIDRFHLAVRVHQMKNGQAEPQQGGSADPAMEEKIMDALGFKL